MSCLQHLSWMLLVTPIFGGLVYPDLGTLSDQQMNDLVYSLLADSNPGSNNMDMSVRAYDYGGGNMYRRSPMELDHNNPTIKLFTANPYHKRSASLFSAMNSRLKNQAFSNGLYKRSLFPLSLRNAIDEKRSAPLFSAMNSRVNMQRLSDGLYKRSEDEIEPIDKRSAVLFSGLNSQARNRDFLDKLFRKRGDNYAYSPVSDLTASNYWNKLFTLYPQSSSYYKRQTQLKKPRSSSPESGSNKNSKSVSVSVRNQKQEDVDKKSDDNASPASL